MTTALRNQVEYMVIGKGRQQAIDLLEEREIEYRFIRSDNTRFVVTDDLVLNRFNLEADNGIITNITFE